MSNVQNPSVSLNNLGQFFEYLPNIDLMLCTDMGTEPADFILSSKDKVVFVHVKCGKSRNHRNPQQVQYMKWEVKL